MLVSNAIRYENIRTFPIDVKVSRKLRKKSVVLLACIVTILREALFVSHMECHEAPSILLREKKKFLSLFARKSVQNILFFVQKINKVSAYLKILRLVCLANVVKRNSIVRLLFGL